MISEFRLKINCISNECEFWFGTLGFTKYSVKVNPTELKLNGKLLVLIDSCNDDDGDFTNDSIAGRGAL